MESKLIEEAITLAICVIASVFIVILMLYFSFMLDNENIMGNFKLVMLTIIGVVPTISWIAYRYVRLSEKASDIKVINYIYTKLTIKSLIIISISLLTTVITQKYTS